MATPPETPPTQHPGNDPGQEAEHSTGLDLAGCVAMHPLIARARICDERGRWLIVRPTGGGSGDYWHLPGGRVEHDEPPRAACAREIREELALNLTPGELIAVAWTAPRHTGPDTGRNVGRHAGGRARVTFIFDMGTHPAAALDASIELQPTELADWRWALPEDALTILHPDLAVRMTAHRHTDPTAVYTEHHPPTTASNPASSLG
jgi:8-oxo-dGTP diphosphatase